MNDDREDIILTRCSTADQHPENQVRPVKKIAPKGAKVYPENESGWKNDGLKHRPVMRGIWDRVAAGKVRSVNVLDIDRLFRNMRTCVAFFELCRANGTIIRSVNQPWLNDFERVPPPFGEMMRDMMIKAFAYFAQQESDKKSKNIKLAYARRTGGWGRKPYPGVIVERILKLRADGLSYRAIRRAVWFLDSKGRRKCPSVTKIHEICSEKV